MTRALAAVMTGVCSAAQVGQESGLGLKRAHTTRARLLAAGLIREVGQQRRAGRPIRLYRAVAEAYIVPFRLTSAADQAELMTVLYRPILDRLVRAQASLISDQRHLRISLRAPQHLVYDLAPQTDAQPGRALGTASTVQLTMGDAQEFLTRLRELQAWLLTRAHDDSAGGAAHDYLYALMVTPAEPQ